MKKYLYQYLFFNVTALIIPVFCILFLYQVGEYENLDSIIKMQQSEKSVYGTALHSNNDLYKMALLNSASPGIIALGSSRVMQLRQHMFFGNFVNLGGLINSINQGLDVAPDIAIKKPNVILFGIDPWWFNDQFQSPSSQYNRKIYHDYYPKLGDVKSVLGWFLNGKIPFQEALKITTTGTSDIGLSGHYKDGFGPDGSYYYTRLITGKKPHNDKEFRNTYQRIENGNNRFQYSSKSNQIHVDNFVRIVKILEQSGAKLIIFFPPFANAINDRLNEMNEAYGYIEDIKSKLRNRGVKFFDYTNAVFLGSSDCEFIDGFHGGEVTYMRILSDLLHKEPSLKDFVNLKDIRSSIGKFKGRAFVSDMNVTNIDEVDFLGIGCEK